MANWDLIIPDTSTGPLAAALRAQSGMDLPAAAGPVNGQMVCIVDAGDDASTLAQVVQLLQVQKPPQLIANISSSQLQSAVERRLGSDGIAPIPILISPQELLAGHFIAANPLFKSAAIRDQPQVHVIMLGFNALGRALLDEIILDAIADRLGHPVIDILAPDASATQAALNREMPEIGASAIINVRPLNLDQLIDREGGILAKIEASAPLTAIFILLETAEATLLASAAIADLQDRRGLAIAPIFIGGPGASTALAIATPKRAPRNIALQIKIIEDLASIPDLLEHILRGRDIIARRVHEAYQAKYARQTAAGTPWEHLAETYRRANRRAGRHLAQKLSAIGIEGNGDPQRLHLVNSVTFAALIMPLVQSAVADEPIRRLARLEHERWCAERRLDGWVFGPLRDEQRRLHPSLIPFDDPRLSADEIGKDIDQLRFLLGFVVAPDEAGAATRLSIGILPQTAAAQPGIALLAVQSRLQQEMEREITLISPLLTVPELNAILALTSWLDQQRRRYSLIIPQWHNDSEGLRDAELAARPEFSAISLRANCCIVPISPGAGDDWADAAASNAGMTALTGYVLKRADLLLQPEASVNRSGQKPDLPV